MLHELEILDPSGHLKLTWDPANPESTDQARTEFDRLKGCGYAFFASEDADAKAAKKLGDSGSLDVRIVATRDFNPRAKRVVAQPPFRGG